jgi:predicted NBD/HSP70 family sugar kinase
MRNTGINLVKCKETNRALLLQLICTSGKITRTELAMRSQLSPMTITNIVNEFLTQKLIIEVAPEDTSRVPGRTPMLLQVSPVSPLIMGIRITNKGLHGVVGTLAMKILTQKEMPLSREDSKETVLKKMQLLTQTMLDTTDRPILGLGISAAGIISREQGTIAYTTNFTHFTELNIRDYLSQYFDFPIYVCNEVHSAALSELYFGHGKAEDNFLYVGVTYGLSAAIVFERKLLDFCGEMGHMTIDSHGPKCVCGGNGCLELYSSTPNILRQIEAETGVSLPDIESAVQFSQTNRTAYAVFHNAMRQLAYGINNYLNLYSVPTVILGHDAYFLPDEMIEQMEKMISSINISMYHFGTKPKLLKTDLGKQNKLYGPICVVLQHLFQDGTTFSNFLSDS